MNKQILSPEYAGFKIRALAHLVDLTILALVTCLLMSITNNLPYPNGIIFKELASLIISLLYNTILTASNLHGTLGKKIMGIMVVNEQMQSLSLKHSFGRYLAYFFSYITLGIGFLMIACTKKHQGLHDKIAHTYVIYSINYDKNKTTN